MAEKMNGLSLDFIIHPGETLKEVLEEKQMSQEELAIRTGFSPKHVSEVVNGKKGISPSFARSLEYVFGIPTSFWINLQGIYDKEMLEYKEQEEIDENEVEIVKKYPLFRKYKIKIIHTGVIIIVDECAITGSREEAVSIAWLEE